MDALAGSHKVFSSCSKYTSVIVNFRSTSTTSSTSTVWTLPKILFQKVYSDFISHNTIQCVRLIGYRRLTRHQPVGLKHATRVIHVTDVVKDASGKVTELKATATALGDTNKPQVIIVWSECLSVHQNAFRLSFNGSVVQQAHLRRLALKSASMISCLINL